MKLPNRPFELDFEEMWLGWNERVEDGLRVGLGWFVPLFCVTFY